MHLQAECLAALYLSLCLLAATTASCGDRPRLVFNNKGSFKLAVFADCEFYKHCSHTRTHAHTHVHMHTQCAVHYGEAENLTWGPHQDSVSLLARKYFDVTSVHCISIELHRGDEENARSGETRFCYVFWR